jgi:putative ABC transport system permease protein
METGMSAAISQLVSLRHGYWLTLLLLVSACRPARRWSSAAVSVIRRDVQPVCSWRCCVAGFVVAGIASSDSEEDRLRAVLYGVEVLAAASFAAVILCAPVNETPPRPALAGAGHAPLSARTPWCKPAHGRRFAGALMLVLLRTDLISSWRQATPADAPNRFVINAARSRAIEFQKALRRRREKFDWYPMICGRLVE